MWSVGLVELTLPTDVAGWGLGIQMLFSSLVCLCQPTCKTTTAAMMQLACILCPSLLYVSAWCSFAGKVVLPRQNKTKSQFRVYCRKSWYKQQSNRRWDKCAALLHSTHLDTLCLQDQNACPGTTCTAVLGCSLPRPRCCRT